MAEFKVGDCILTINGVGRIIHISNCGGVLSYETTVGTFLADEVQD